MHACARKMPVPSSRRTYLPGGTRPKFMQNGAENSRFWHEPKHRARLSEDKNDAPAALCGVAGACDVVVRFNLPEKTMSRPPKHQSTGPAGKKVPRVSRLCKSSVSAVHVFGWTLYCISSSLVSSSSLGSGNSGRHTCLNGPLE